MMVRAEALLLCIKTLTPPSPLPPAPPPPPPEKWRTVDLAREQPNWASELFEHLNNYEATRPFAEQHDAAGKAARALIPDDVGRVLAAGYTLARNKRGVVSITRRALP
jgi:hypothetical protein